LIEVGVDDFVGAGVVTPRVVVGVDCLLGLLAELEEPDPVLVGGVVITGLGVVKL
jgi:hypothetical protein